MIWVLVRVAPKPARAAYPCQRVAMPLASGFLLWLASMGGASLAFRHARGKFQQARYVTGAEFNIDGGILAGSAATPRVNEEG